MPTSWNCTLVVYEEKKGKRKKERKKKKKKKKKKKRSVSIYIRSSLFQRSWREYGRTEMDEMKTSLVLYTSPLLWVSRRNFKRTDLS